MRGGAFLLWEAAQIIFCDAKWVFARGLESEYPQPDIAEKVATMTEGDPDVESEKAFHNIPG